MKTDYSDISNFIKKYGFHPKFFNHNEGLIVDDMWHRFNEKMVNRVFDNFNVSVSSDLNQGQYHHIRISLIK